MKSISNIIKTTFYMTFQCILVQSVYVQKHKQNHLLGQETTAIKVNCLTKENMV